MQTEIAGHPRCGSSTAVAHRKVLSCSPMSLHGTQALLRLDTLKLESISCQPRAPSEKQQVSFAQLILGELQL